MKVNRDPKPVLRPGRWSAIIHRAEEKTSKRGNPMMVLSLKVEHDDTTFWITEYVVNTAYKTIDAILECVGYPPGGENFDADKLEGMEVVVVTKIDEQEGYDPQAKVERWVPKKDAIAKAVSAPAKQAAAAAKANASAAKKAAVADDDVPF